MKKYTGLYQTILYFLVAAFFCNSVSAQPAAKEDTTIIFTPSNPNLIHPQSYRPLVHAWGIDLLLSNNGFGLGGFYRYEITDEFSWMLSLVFSDVKDDAEVEQYDYYGNSYIPGKKNRLLLIPLTASLQYRLFKDDIADNFRPFITAGLGPTMMFVAPYANPTIYYFPDSTSYIDPGKIDFFTSLKYGKLRYSIGGFVGAGVYFGIEKGSLTSLSVKYFLTRFPDGIEVMYGGYTKNFGGLFIMLTFGSLF